MTPDITLPTMPKPVKITPKEAIISESYPYFEKRELIIVRKLTAPTTRLKPITVMT